MSGSTRTIWIMALTAVVSLGAGLGLSQLIVSPADAAANAAPPEPGPITVPVELKELENDVVLRGDVVYEDPVDVTIEAGDLGGTAVVTGRVPAVGATLNAGDVMLEIAGRPVILLPGDLPVYRTLRVGVSGPDVLQLKAALASLGLNPGDVASNAYDTQTAAAVQALYERAGYEVPTGGEEAQEAVETARDGVRAAEEQVGAAQRAVATAGAGIKRSERIALDTAADTAQARLNQARAACEGGGTPESPCDPTAVVEAQGMLAQAVAAREEGLAAPDAAEERAALASAQRALDDAREELARAQEDVITPLPAAEVVFLSNLPRRVDDVDVRRGATVEGAPVAKVSGATLQIAGNVSAEDAALVPVGAVTTITMPDGSEIPGTVQSIGTPPADAEGEDGDEGEGEGGGESGGAGGAGADGRMRLVVVPDALTDEQRGQLQGANVRMTIEVGSTEGEVLAVPTAALTAGPGGEARVEVLSGDESTLVTVQTGLAAAGFVEVTAIDGTLAEGDRVVVGVTAAGQTESPDEAEDEGSDG
ncbi:MULTISPECIES: hypothetical protein [unclassified Actinotalea]|uniref:hypothetical protein n=1 Tax=unclassified Actinotalea TaxID=2638618 RepID=UPI0021067BA6|nr:MULTISPECIES: hypothetical protein [unclassified Actinotalea]